MTSNLVLDSCWLKGRYMYQYPRISYCLSYLNFNYARTKLKRIFFRAVIVQVVEEKHMCWPLLFLSSLESDSLLSTMRQCHFKVGISIIDLFTNVYKKQLKLYNHYKKRIRAKDKLKYSNSTKLIGRHSIVLKVCHSFLSKVIWLYSCLCFYPLF